MSNLNRLRNIVCATLCALFVLAVALPLVSAADLDTSNAGVTQLFSDYVYSGDSFEAGELILSTSIGTNNEVAYIDAGIFDEFVRIGDCEIDELYALCLDSIDTDDNRRRAYIRVYQLQASISVSREFSDLTPYPGQLVTVNIDFTNDGFLDIEDILYEDSYPEELVVERVLSPCKQSGNTIFYDQDIDSDDTVSCEYELRPSSLVSLSHTSLVQYFDGFKDVVKYLDSQTIAVEDVVDVSIAFNESSADIKETRAVVITATNNNVDDDSTVPILEVLFPPELLVTVPHGTFTKVQDGYYRRENIEVAVEEEYEFIVYPMHPGEFTTTVRGTYSSGEALQGSFEEVATALDVELIELVLSSDSDESDKESYEEETIRIWVENNNPDVAFVNLQANIPKNDLIHVSDLSMSELLPLSSRKIVDIAFEAPVVTETTTYEIEVNVTYETEFGDKGSEDFTWTVTVNPISDIQVDYSFTDSTIYPGNSTQLTVSLTNKRDLDLDDVKAYDVITEGVETIGSKSITVDLDADATQEAYSYHLIGPEVDEQTSYLITTVVTYERDGNEFTVNDSTTFTVNTLTPVADPELNASIDITRTIADSTILTRDQTSVSYEILSDGSIPAHHILVEFPLQYEFDLIGPRNYFIPTLNPDDEVTLTEHTWYRPKLNGTYELRGDTVSFVDETGKAYEVIGSNATIEVTVGQNFSSPALLVTKEVPTIVTEQEEVLVNITIENVGKVEGVAKVYDSDKEWDITIAPESSRKIQHRYAFTKPGLLNVSAAEVEYEHLGVVYYTGSERYEVLVLEDENAVTESDAQETTETSENETGTADAIEQDTPGSKNTEVIDGSSDEPSSNETDSPSEKGFFARIWEKIMGFFR